MHLREVVTEEDAKRAVTLIDYYLEKIARSGSGYDIDMVGGETTNKDRVVDRKAIDVIKGILSKYSPTGGIQVEQIVEESGLDSTVVHRNLEILRDMMEVMESRGKYRLI